MDASGWGLLHTVYVVLKPARKKNWGDKAYIVLLRLLSLLLRLRLLLLSLLLPLLLLSVMHVYLHLRCLSCGCCRVACCRSGHM